MNYVVSRGEWGQKLPILLSKKTTKRGRGSKIADFETAQFKDGPLWSFQTTRTFSRSLGITFHPEVSFNLMASVRMFLRSPGSRYYQKVLFTAFSRPHFQGRCHGPKKFPLVKESPPFDIFRVRPVTFCLGFFWSFFSFYPYSAFFLSLVLPATNLLDFIRSFHLPF